MSTPPPSATGTSSAAIPQGTGNRWLGITALVYSAGVAAFEMITLIGTSTLVGLGSHAIALVIFLIPVLLIIGIVLCIVAGAVAPRWRKLAVIGGLLMLLPVIVSIGSTLVYALLGTPGLGTPGAAAALPVA
jgi:hypothetical protein